MADCAALEMLCAGNRTGGSNPPLSAYRPRLVPGSFALPGDSFFDWSPVSAACVIRILVCLCVLISGSGHAVQAVQLDAAAGGGGDREDQPVFEYLALADGGVVPLETSGSAASANRLPWSARATSGVCFAEATEQICGRTAVFDGASLIDIAGSSNFPACSLSVEFWFCSEQVWDAKYWPGSATLVTKFTGGWASGDWGIIGGSLSDGVNEGRILVGVGPSGGADVVLASEPGLNDGRFHHIVWTRDETGENVLYVDGNLADRAMDNGGSIVSGRPIQIGGEGLEQGGRYFRGALTALAVYTHVLSADRVRTGFDTAVAARQLPPSVNRSVDFAGDIKPLFRKYCFECHGRGAEHGGFSLGTRVRMVDGGESGRAVMPGRSISSALIHRIAGFDAERVMPPEGPRMSAAEVGLIRSWIDQGAIWPEGEDEPDPQLQRFKSHWSFQPLRQPVVPAPEKPESEQWVRGPVDRFIVAALEQQHLQPASEASRHELLRRVHFDLTGLPPSPDRIRAFLSDTRPEAFALLVDELLATTAYAERWARHWLDVVRYADSGGFETDILYEQAWHYRDYVIRSLAAGKPIDRFLMEQVAGDEIWPDDAATMSDAVALWTLGPWPNALDQFPDMLEYVRRTDQVTTFGEALLGMTVGCANCHNHKYDPISQRDYFGLEAIFAASETWDRHTDKKGWAQGERSHYRILRHGTRPPPIRLLGRGELSRPRGLVAPAIPAFFSGGGELPRGDGEHLRRRKNLAEWLVSPNNPLAARTFVNRVWQWHFGTGLVATPNDLGLKGAAPSHPELLDWLACDFRDSGWDLKQLHRRILLSATWQQSVHRSAEAIKADPENRFLSAFPSRRLSAEEIWDHLHSAAGTLNLESYGPPIVPQLTAEELLGIYDIEQNAGKKWPVTAEQSRRAIYILNRRSFRFPFFEAFDPPGNSVSCPTRQTTTVPTQALTMLNNSMVQRQAQAMSAGLWKQAGPDESAQLKLAWLLAFSREMTPQEQREAGEFLAQARRSYRDRGVDRAAERALADLCLALFNSSEFISIN